MITCKQATEWIDTKDYSKLSLKQRFDLKIHLLLCKLCNDYAKKSKVIDIVLSKIFGNKYKHIENPKLQERIIVKINNQSK